MKIESIRPRNPSDSQKDAYLQDVAKYETTRKDFVERLCPGCQSSNAEIFAEHLGFRFDKCKSCFSVYMNPGPTSEMVQEFYTNSSNYEFWSKEIYPNTRESRRSTLHRNRANFVLSMRDKFLKSGKIQKVLEVGAGTGDTLSVLAEISTDNMSTFGVEPNVSMQTALELNGIEVIQHVGATSENNFDVIMAFEVIEHFLHPNELFELYGPLLAEDGLMILSTPNAHSLEVQFLKHTSTTIDVEHISVLSPAGIHSLANRNGFRVLEISTPGNFDLELMDLALFNIAGVVESRALERAELQALISESGLSSHMKVVLKKSPR